MKYLIPVLGLLLLLPVTSEARDDKKMYEAAPVIERGIKEKIFDDSVAFYFGDTAHPAVLKSFGDVKTNKKTNAFNKTDEEACHWVFLSAIKAFHARAKKLGADSVINIRSNYRKNEIKDNTSYQCGAGTFSAGTALIGEFVKTR